MANKRTIINADEELIIQGKLTVEGEFVQKEFVETISYSESKFAGDFLVVNSDGYDLSNNPTDATLRLRYGSANADIVWDGTAFVFSQDIHVANIVSTGSLTGYLDGTANLAHQFTSPVTVSITGDATGSSSFTGAGNTATIVTTLVPQTTLTAGTYGDAVSVPTITVAGNGIVRAVTNTAIDHDALLNFVADEHVGHSSVRILAGAGLTGGGDITADRSLNVVAADSSIVVNADNIQVSESWVESLFSVTDTGGDGSLSYANGVITYTGPDQTEANARIAAAPDQVRAHLSATNGVSYNSGTGVFQAVESEIQHDNLDGFDPDEHIAHSSVNLTAGNGLVGGGTITSSRTFHVGQGDGIGVGTDAISVDSTVVRTSGTQFIDGEKHFNDGIIMASDIIPDSGNLYSLGNSTNYFDYVFANVLHAQALDLGDANIHDIHTTFDAGIRTTNLYYDNKGEGLQFTHNTEGASYAVSPGRGLQIDGVDVAVDSTVILTDRNATATADYTFNGTVDLSSATVPGFTVAGDLTVEGVFNTENVVDTYVQDTKITLNSNNTVTDNNVSIEVNRPVATAAGGNDTAIRWNESIDKWQFSNDGDTYHDMLTTEQTTNLISVANPSGFGNLSYDAGSGTITHVGTSQQDIRDQFSTTGTGIDYDVSAGEFQANVSEIRGYVSAVKVAGDGAFTYNSGTGAFSYTGPGLTEAQGHILSSATQVRSHFTGGEAIDINNGTISLGNVTQAINFNNGIIKIQNDSISIGASAGTHAAGEGNSIAIGNEAGAASQDRNSVAIGFQAGSQSQYRDSVAIGHLAGNDEQGVSAGAGRAVAVGFQAGQTNQGGQALALGESAGLTNQGQGAVAIGTTAGAVYQGEFAVAIGPEAGKGTGSPFARQANNSIVIRAGDSSYPAVTGANIGAFYVSPIRQNSDDTSNVLMYNFDEKEVTSVASTIFVSSTANQTVSGTKTFSGELIIPDSSATTNGAIYYDSTINDAYIYINGVAKKITPAVDAGDVEAVGAGTYDVYAGTRVDGPTTYHGIKSINQGSYMSISEASNVITIGADISSIRGAFSASDVGGDGSFSYNSGTGTFSYTGPSALETRAHFSASGLLSYNSTTGAFTTTADNYGNWNFRTDSGAGSEQSVTSNQTISILGGTNITVTNSGGIITIANDNTADITGVNAGAGLTGGGGSGTVTLNVVAGDGIVVNPDSVTVDSTVVRTSGAQTIAGDKTFSDAVQVDSLNIANNYDFPIADGSTNQVLATDGSGQLSFQDVTAIGGTITGVTAGAGLTGGGIAGTVNLDIGAGTGISVAADSISVNMGAFDTGDLAEGTNQYFTTARARSALSGSSGVNYNSTTGAITADTAEIRSLFSASGDISYNSATGQFSFTNDAGDIESVTAGTGLTGGGTSGAVTLNVVGGTGIVANANDIAIDFNEFDTDALQEGASNLFFTTSRARSSISVSGDLSYNSTTGVISYTRGPGDIESVTAGTGLTGGGTSGAVTLSLATAGAGAGTYGSTGDNTKIDSITLDAYGRVTAVATGATGDIQGVTAGSYLTGGGTSGTVTLNVDATTTNTASKVVARDASGNFSAGTITASLTGNASSATQVYVTEDNTNVSLQRLVFQGGDGSSNKALKHSDNLTYTPNTGTLTAGTFSDGTATLTGGVLTGIATSARYADLAEKYESDSNYECGTVVVFGGEKEITVTDTEDDHRVAGIISTDPAYMMNSEADGQYVALRGRVPCKVIGPVKKGDVLITSSRPGFAMASDQPHFVSASCIVGKSLQDFDGTEGVVEVVV